MTKFLKTYWIFAALVILLIGGVGYFLFAHKSQPSQVSNNSIVPTQTIPNQKISTETPSPTSIPTPTASTKQIINTVTTVPAGPPNGQIVCNYQIPVGPNTYGTADIKANWSNLLTGKNGSVQAAVCVTPSTQTATVMTLSASSNGSWENNISWIAPNVNYTFTLYDQHGGDLPNCAGAALSSCEIHAMLAPTVVPGSPGGR
jgi:hypothetical protein